MWKNWTFSFIINVMSIHFYDGFKFYFFSGNGFGNCQMWKRDASKKTNREEKRRSYWRKGRHLYETQHKKIRCAISYKVIHLIYSTYNDNKNTACFAFFNIIFWRKAILNMLKTDFCDLWLLRLAIKMGKSVGLKTNYFFQKLCQNLMKKLVRVSLKMIIKMLL